MCILIQVLIVQNYIRVNLFVAIVVLVTIGEQGNLQIFGHIDMRFLT